MEKGDRVYIDFRDGYRGHGEVWGVVTNIDQTHIWVDGCPYYLGDIVYWDYS